MTQAKAWIFGNNVDTDQIIPARYLNTKDPKELAKHCLEDTDPEFARTAGEGDVIIAGTNFGSGSSREHAPLAIKAKGIRCVIAKSFARIFFRNAINIGLPLIEDETIARHTRAGDIVEIDFSKNTMRNITQNTQYAIKPFPAFIMNLINAGGLINYAKKKLEKK
jgi:3-isopropylmalate/(R)-2-methylmalate dehydratase small subunit